MKKSNKNVHKIREIGKGGIEDYLRKEVIKRGGFCIKQNPNWHTGIYDRLVGLPGFLCLVETKRPVGGRLRLSQRTFKKSLQKLNIPHYELHTFEMIDEFLKPYPLRESHETAKHGTRFPL